jgi:RNA polymerase sigma factor (sigma-70 family)
MNVHVSYKVHKTPDLEKDFQHQIDKLRRRLQVFRPELVHLKGLVEPNSAARKGIAVSLNLRLPSGQMAAQQTAPTAVAAVKAAFEDLKHQITRHKDLLRSTHKWARRRSASSPTEAQVPFEKTLAAVAAPLISPEDIRGYVNANLGRLEAFVERELAYREAEERLQADAIGKDEVIDEVIAGALSENGDRPERLALEPWLYRLAIHAIEDLSHPTEDGDGNVHLGASVRKRNVLGSDEPELQFHQADESFTQETIIADRRVSTPEQLASSDEMLRLVENALRGTDRRAREAFILHALEGFTADEIAAITDSKPDEVRASVSIAREHLRKSPLFRGSPGRATGVKTVASHTGTA